jgi:hypothetical protein
VVFKALDDLPRTVSLKADLTAVKALLEPLHEAAR